MEDLSAGCDEMIADSLSKLRFELFRRQAPAIGALASAFEKARRHVIAITPRAFAGMRGRKPIAGFIDQLPSQKRAIARCASPARLILRAELCLNPVPKRLIDERLMQTVVDFALVANAPNINWIAQQEMNVATPERFAADFSVIAEGP